MVIVSLRRLFLIITILLIIIFGFIWILNIEGVIKGAWSTPLSAIFTILASLFAFLQVAFLISSPSAPKQEISVTSSVFRPISKIPPLAPLMLPIHFPPSYEDYKSFAKIRCKNHGIYGSLAIYASEEMNNQAIYLIKADEWIRHETNDIKNMSSESDTIYKFTFEDKLIYAMFFAELFAGTYIITNLKEREASAVVNYNEITMIDWS